MSRRVPWPWEDIDLEETDSTVDYARVVALPDNWCTPGGRSPRDVREQMAADIARNMTDGSDEGRAWARRKAETALRRWDRGVQSGAIKRPRS